MKKLYLIPLVLFILFVWVLLNQSVKASINYDYRHVSPLRQDTTMEELTCDKIEPPKYSATFVPNIVLGAHDYYNEVIHGDKANITSVELTIDKHGYSMIVEFDSLDDVSVSLTELDCGKPVVVYVSVETDSKYAYTHDLIIILNGYIIDDELIIEATSDTLVFDFVYDTRNIKYPLTEVERNLLSSLLAHEYGYKNALEGQHAVVSVVFNRLDYFGGTLHDIIYAPNQFTPAELINAETGLSTYKDINTHYSHCTQSVDYVAAYGVTIPHSVLYFRTNHYFKWSTITDYKNIGTTYFSGLTTLIDKYDEWSYYN